jgi:uncharacterized protein involved in exopolysaccharide biosynthesis
MTEIQPQGEPFLESTLMTFGDLMYLFLKRKGLFFLTWTLCFSLFLAYALLSKKTYEIEGTLSIGKFNEDLVEEGEFVARKLEDYSFIKEAMDARGLELNQSISRFKKFVTAEVVNEIRKNDKVGLVKLRVRYKEKEHIVEVFQALVDHLKRQHQDLIDQGVAILQEEEAEISELAQQLERSVDVEARLSEVNLKLASGQTLPSLLMAQNIITANRSLHSSLVEQRYKVRLNREAATKTIPTQLCATPQEPDEHMHPILTLVLLIGSVVATGVASVTVLLWTVYCEQVLTRLNP